MRKGFLVGLALFLFSPVFSLDVPESLCGIWEGKDRFVFFEQIPADRNPQLVLLLKEYYGWYIDRTAEPLEFSENVSRTRNTGTTKNAELIDLSFETLLEGNDFWAGYVKLGYSKSQMNVIPVCQLGGKMYLDFYCRDEENPQFYGGGAVARGIQIAKQEIPENITGYVIDEDKIFNIRYWKTDMDYSEDNASFAFNEKTYTVPRHIKTADAIYSCVSGRSKRIRNILPPNNFKKDDFLWNEDESVMIADKDFYLYRLANHKTFDNLISIVKEQNSKRKPEPTPLFPPEDLNWHWDMINYLDKYNEQVQKVRNK